MKRIELLKVPHDKKVGDKVAPLPANITEDTLFIEDGEIIGFYINDMAKYSKKACKLADIADNELRSKRVPKSEMSRGPQGNKADKLKREQEGKQLVTQYSVILGGVGPKPHMRRNYPTVSMKLIMPKQYEIQKQLIEDNSPKKYRFCDLFTSSISNFNISADYHIDRANIKGCCNVIIAKRMSSTGGNTTVPDYDATFDSADNSMLVYPAWRNLHGVTPIETKDGGYRNTLVFYPLASFAKFK